jgi:hypothetical protein
MGLLLRKPFAMLALSSSRVPADTLHVVNDCTRILMSPFHDKRTESRMKPMTVTTGKLLASHCCRKFCTQQRFA